MTASPWGARAVSASRRTRRAATYISSNTSGCGVSSASAMNAARAIEILDRWQSPSRLVLRHPRNQRLALGRHPTVARQAVNGGLGGRYVADARVLAPSLPNNGIERFQQDDVGPLVGRKKPKLAGERLDVVAVGDQQRRRRYWSQA